MKIITLLSLPLLMTAAASASDAETLVFRTRSGEEHALDCRELKITFSESQLMATSGTELLELPLASLESMRFDDTPLSVEVAPALDGPVTAFSADGLPAGNFESLSAARAALPSGIYLLRYNDGTTLKMTVRQ